MSRNEWAKEKMLIEINLVQILLVVRKCLAMVLETVEF